MFNHYFPSRGNSSEDGSTVVQAFALFNVTVGATQISAVGGRLADLEQKTCVFLADSCVDIISQSKITALGIYERGNIKY